MKEEIQKDLDDGKFGMICSNEETFMSYVMQKCSKDLEQLRAEVEGLRHEIKDKEFHSDIDEWSTIGKVSYYYLSEVLTIINNHLSNMEGNK
jgi:hypothetical protein